MSATMNKVLETPELLEHILLQLDMRTLLTSAQRVSRNWHTTITASPSLQKALFFLADSPESVGPSSTSPAPTPPPRRNPLLASIFTPFFPDPSQLQSPTPPPQSISDREFWDSPLARDTPRFLHEHASWRRMLVQQRPPARALGFWDHWHGMDGDWDETRTEQCPDGLRMEQLYARAQKFLEDDQAGLRVLWGTNHNQQEDPAAAGGSRFRVDDQPSVGRGLSWIGAADRERIEGLAGSVDVLLARSSVFSCIDFRSTACWKFVLTFALDGGRSWGIDTEDPDLGDCEEEFEQAVEEMRRERPESLRLVGLA